MQTLHIHRRLESETLPELKSWIGRDVEITIVEQSPAPRATEQDWEAFFAAAGPDLADPELTQQYREFDRQRNVAPEL